MSQRLLGPLVTSWSIEQACRTLLLPDRNLIGAYLDEVNRQRGQTAVRMERPRSVLTRWSVRRNADDQLPAILLVNGGTLGDAERDGDGLYRATWQLGVAAITQSTDEGVARGSAAHLSWAATAVLAQMLPKVDSRVLSVQWMGEEPPINLGDDDRSRCIFAQRLAITVADILSDLSGLPADWNEPDPPITGSPSTPPLNTGDLETVLTTLVTVEPVEEVP